MTPDQKQQELNTAYALIKSSNNFFDRVAKIYFSCEDEKIKEELGEALDKASEDLLNFLEE